MITVFHGGGGGDGHFPNDYDIVGRRGVGDDVIYGAPLLSFYCHQANISTNRRGVIYIFIVYLRQFFYRNIEALYIFKILMFF